MPKIYAFDNRTGAVNEAVTLHRPRTPAQAGLDGWKRHPRIDWQAGTPASAPVPPPQQTRPVPATEMERLQRYGGCYAAAVMMLAGEPPSALAALAGSLEPTGGGVYEALLKWAHDHRA